MPFIVKARQRTEQPEPGLRRMAMLTPADTADARVVIDRWQIDAGHELALDIAPGALAWLQVLGGEVALAGETLTPDIMTRLPAGFSGTLRAAEAADIALSQVPDAARFGHPEPDVVSAPKSFDWTREPVLQSMHDDRKRIYVATRSLFETSALKGEIIIYPPGATCPKHHHEGAEHYLLIVRGSGIANVDDVETEIAAGDVFYIFEDERHWFRNEGGEDLVFVEYFVPGTAKTIWAPGADICEWQPTGADIEGREPSRHIPQHSHGDATPL